MKTIKLYQARALINQRNVDGLFYVDKVPDEDCPDIIFKSNLSDQLYSFYYLGLTIDTAKEFDVFLYDGDNKNLDIKVAPVKKLLVPSYKYIGNDSND